MGLRDTYGELDYGRTTWQVALEREGDTEAVQWGVSEVKACHITPQSTATLFVHLDTAGKPYALDLFVSPVPRDGLCPSSKGIRKAGSEVEEERPLSPAFSRALVEGATLVIKRSASAPAPELRAPPKLAAGGEPVKPVVEESFFQKYWLYGLGILIAIVLSGSGPEPEKGGGK